MPHENPIGASSAGGVRLVYFCKRPSLVPERYDLVIENARLADGMGGVLTNGSIAIRDGRIVAVGKLDSRLAVVRIDAGGKVAAPGFIDVHTHSECRGRS